MQKTKLLISSLPGLGQLSRQELRDKLAAAVSNAATSQVRNNDLTTFEFTGKLSDLWRLGTVEDVFYGLTDTVLSGQPEDLRVVQDAVTAAAGLDRALAHHRVAAGGRGRKRTRFRVVVQADDAKWRQYRRLELQKTCQVGVQQKYPSWKLVQDEADLEFWIHQVKRRALVSLRLSDKTMRHRDYKIANLPASLRPTIAYAMAYLAGIGQADVFLDPFCGAGTILIERARAGRYQLLLGGDINQAAVDATLANLGKKHKPWRIEPWDARSLPLDDQSVDKIVTNLPWGRQIGLKA
ncbi:MAG TPA: hypothetical protein VK963_02310, partial [Candidatus Saccharimonadales bacterium]|nr:hypothetical protein [Candidatus Saccharimonadales bacterium]